MSIIHCVSRISLLYTRCNISFKYVICIVDIVLVVHSGLNLAIQTCSSSGFSCVGVRVVYWSLRCTATFVIRFHWLLLLAFSLHFSSSSAFLRSLFTQSSLSYLFVLNVQD